MEFSSQAHLSELPFSLLGIFLTQGSNPDLLCGRQILHLSELQEDNVLESEGKMICSEINIPA